MQKKIIVILLTSFTLTLFAQTSNHSRFLCQSDSVSYYTVKSLADNGIQAIMTFYYAYDNGRTPGETHYIIWLDNNFNGHLKKVTGCDNPIIKDTILNKSIHDIFDFYTSNQIDTITKDIESRVSMSHDMGYYIKVYLPNKTKDYNIRNFQRGVGVFVDGKRTDGKETFNLKDPRIIWINLFETTVGPVN